MRLSKRFIRFLPISAIILFCFAALTAFSEDLFSIQRVGNLIPFQRNAFLVHAPEKGILTISVHDDVCIYRTITQDIDEGDTSIVWDGCGFNKEKLYSKSYTITAELETAGGKTYTESFLTPVEYSGQNLQYALPSSGKLFLDATGDWFLEFRTVSKGSVIIELVSASDPDVSYRYSAQTAGGKIYRRDFRSIAGKELPAEGRYRLIVYEASVPDNHFEYELEILDHAPEQKSVFITGEILPDRAMSDSEIWSLMMKPSVVVDIDFFSHQQIFKDPDPASVSLGTVHGQTQALKVIRLDGTWAFVGAWNHEEAEYVEGWIPLDRLKVVEPQRDYGLLVDKKKQTLSVYYRGHKMDTLLVSTGRAEKNRYEQETSAGSYLTGYHRVDFSMNGKKYDYVIQYDGGNLLHQAPYEWGLHKKDFTLGRGYLGTKASHACIRIQPEPADGGLNAYWIWTHIPYHTRVLILDDAEERRDYVSKLKRGQNSENNFFSSLSAVDSEEEAPNSDAVIMTFSGCMIPGGTPAFNLKDTSFVSAYLKNRESPFIHLIPWFENDDLTCIQMKGFLKNPPTEYLPGTEAEQAPPETAEIFSSSSIELVMLQNDAVSSPYGGKDAEETHQSVRSYASALTGEEPYQVLLKDRMFGFACCSETEYLKNPKVIDERIRQLKEKQCERIVFLCIWKEGNNNSHSIIQEAMAHRCVRAGADLVIGNQINGVLGADWIEEVPVIYSTGMLMNGSQTQTGRESGFIVRAVFSFNSQKKSAPDISIISINPYGAEKGEKNTFCPDVFPSAKSSEKVLDAFWNDSTDGALAKISFIMQKQR